MKYLEVAHKFYILAKENPKEAILIFIIAVVAIVIEIFVMSASGVLIGFILNATGIN